MLCSACERRAPIHSCTDDLQGEWRAEGDQRWMMLDFGSSLEAYPLFDDVTGPRTQTEVAPRMIELTRTGTQLAGVVRRRYMHANEVCVAAGKLEVASCTSDTLELRLAEPAPPTRFGPCQWGPEPLARTIRWHRE